MKSFRRDALVVFCLIGCVGPGFDKTRMTGVLRWSMMQLLDIPCLLSKIKIGRRKRRQSFRCGIKWSGERVLSPPLPMPTTVPPAYKANGFVE